MVFGKVIIAVTFIFISSSASLIKTKQATDCCEEYCYDEDIKRPQYNNFASKSAYSLSKGNDSQIYNIEGCSATKIWLLIRHGTRLPSPQSMAQLNDLEELRDEIIILYDNNETNLTLPEKGRLCEADLELLKNWKWDPNITAEYDEHLTLSGWNELKELAKDFKNAFPDVIGNIYSPEKFRFSHTNYQRTEASYKAFVEGLFGDGSYNDFAIDPPSDPDMILNPQSLCEAYRQNVIAQNGPDAEIAKFRNSEMYQKLRSDVSTKIGYFSPAFQPLTHVDIINIYDMCRFDIAWRLESSSPWCSILAQSQIKILEYEEDLDFYMKQSYGSDINLRLACGAMDDMLTYLTTDDSPKLVAYFGHTDNIHSVLTAMGAVKDANALRADNYETMANRKWKTSDICPFAANLAVVKYNCPNDADEVDKIKFFLNQKTLHLDWCDMNGICKLSDMKQEYSSFRGGDCSEIFCSNSRVFKCSREIVSILLIVLFLVNLS